MVRYWFIVIHIGRMVSCIRVFNDYGIKNYTFQHANEAFKVAPEIAKNGAYTSVFAIGGRTNLRFTIPRLQCYHFK